MRYPEGAVDGLIFCVQSLLIWIWAVIAGGACYLITNR